MTMAGTRRNDLLGRIADISEEAVQRLSDAPGADKVIGALNTLRDRTDELQKRVRGIETLEQRVEALERKVEKLMKAAGDGSGASRGAKGTSTKSSGATAAKKS
jgi:hypothetical protein